MESRARSNDVSLDSADDESRKVNLDIQQLEMLRDVLTSKAQVLRLQERLFRKSQVNADGTTAENRAVKKELLDYIITLFGYLTPAEVRQLVTDISKEHNLKILACIETSLKNRLLEKMRSPDQQPPPTTVQEEDEDASQLQTRLDAAESENAEVTQKLQEFEEQFDEVRA